MFGLFKKKSEKDKLQQKHKELMQQAYDLSRTDRSASDAKTAEAEQVLKQIEALDSASNS